MVDTSPQTAPDSVEPIQEAILSPERQTEPTQEAILSPERQAEPAQEAILSPERQAEPAQEAILSPELETAQELYARRNRHRGSPYSVGHGPYGGQYSV